MLYVQIILIVPYGIETIYSRRIFLHRLKF